MYTHACICMCLYMYVCIYMYMDVYTYIRHICIYIWMDVYGHTCKYVYVCMFMYAYGCICIRTPRIRTQPVANVARNFPASLVTLSRDFVVSHIMNIYVYVCIHTYAFVCMYIYVLEYMCMYIYALVCICHAFRNRSASPVTLSRVFSRLHTCIYH